MYRVTFDILRRSSAILTEEPGRWSNRYLHCGLNDVTATKKRDEMGLTRELHGFVQHPPRLMREDTCLLPSREQTLEYFFQGRCTQFAALRNR